MIRIMLHICNKKKYPHIFWLPATTLEERAQDWKADIDQLKNFYILYNSDQSVLDEKSEIIDADEDTLNREVDEIMFFDAASTVPGPSLLRK